VNDDIDLLKRAIAKSGLSARRFAVEILTRDERTIRRWLDGDRPIPRVVRRKLLELLGEPPEADPPSSTPAVPA
jgi:hypothetical protein